MAADRSLDLPRRRAKTAFRRCDRYVDERGESICLVSPEDEQLLVTIAILMKSEMLEEDVKLRIQFLDRVVSLDPFCR